MAAPRLSRRALAQTLCLTCFSPGRVDAMELSTLTPELPQLLADMGVRYDPERLANALGSRPTGEADPSCSPTS